MQTWSKLSIVGLGLLAVSSVTLVIPSTPLGGSTWQTAPFYLFVISSLTAPLVLRHAKKGDDSTLRYAYYLSWVPFGLCVILLAGLWS